MSKARAKARAAREAAAAAEREAAARAAARKARVAGLKPPRPQVPRREPVYRFRRFSRLPWRLKAALAAGWLAVAAVVLYLAPTWTGRLGLLVVATAALPLIVVLVRDPSRRTR